MRILIVTQYFWPEQFRVNDLAQGLQTRGHEVTVLTGMPNYPFGRIYDGYSPFSPREELYGAVRVKRTPLVPRLASRGWQLALNYASFALSASISALTRIGERPDVVLAFQPSPITVALPAIAVKRARGSPVMLWVQDLWPENLSATGAVKSPRILALVATLVRFIYRHCDLILVQSAGFIPRVAAMGAPAKKIVYFPNWAESLYRPLALPADAPERALVPEGFRVMFAGNIGAAQSFETILGAAEILRNEPHIRWVVIGDGHLRGWVEDEVRRRGLEKSVVLLGRHPVESMPRFFALADVLLVTLRDDPVFALTIPSKVQSYQACGRPIVAALGGEGARVIDEARCGVTAPPDDPAALAEAVLALFRMPPAAREAMGARGREYFIEHFEREKLLDQLEDCMREAAEARCAS
jgi:glycosyltransferase involved in cell wall biosynthesis